MARINLISIGAYVPERKLTNAELEKMVDTSDNWIVERTGIRERRIAAADQFSHDMAALAAARCLERSSNHQPDLVISSTSTPGRLCPYHASLICHRLKLAPKAAFDINAACSGLLYGLSIAQNMMNGVPDLYKNVLITSGEKMSQVTDYTDRNSCILFGDGGSAVMLSSESGGHELCAVETGITPALANCVAMGGKGDEYFFRQDGRQVYRFAVSTMGNLIDSLLRKGGLTMNESVHIIPHQANLRMMQAVAEQKKIPFSRFVTNIEKYGNTSSASIGIALEEAWMQNRFKPGDHLLLIAFGGGLSWGGALIRW